MGANSDPAITALREALAARLGELSDEATARIVSDIPAYNNIDDQLRRDVRAHVEAHLTASIETLGSGRDVTREDLLFVRPHAARRTRRVSVTDFIRAFYVGERVHVGRGTRAGSRRGLEPGRAGLRLAPAALLRGRDDPRRRGVPGGAGGAGRHRRADPPRPARGPAGRARARAGTAPRCRPRGRAAAWRFAAGHLGDSVRQSRATRSCCAVARRRSRAPPVSQRCRSRSCAGTRSSSCSRLQT